MYKLVICSIATYRPTVRVYSCDIHVDILHESIFFGASKQNMTLICWLVMSGLETLVQAQGIMQEIGDRLGETRCLIELSHVQFLGSNFPEAVKFAKEVLF